MAETLASPATAETSVPLGATETQLARPSAFLSTLQLVQISIFWFALNAIWGGFELFQQKRVIALVGDNAAGAALGILDFLALPVAMVTMPVAGSISDYWVSRHGRRKPFILVGSLGGAAAFVGVALAPSFATLLASFLVMQLT